MEFFTLELAKREYFCPGTSKVVDQCNFTCKGNYHLGVYEDLEEPIDFLRTFFEIEMIRLISKQTNLCSTQCNINMDSIGTSLDETGYYFGVLLHMCIVQMPRYRMYWETETLRTSSKYNEQESI